MSVRRSSAVFAADSVANTLSYGDDCINSKRPPQRHSDIWVVRYAAVLSFFLASIPRTYLSHFAMPARFSAM